MSNNNGGPAFPGPETFVTGEGYERSVQRPGMSLRDWFAGMAMQGIVTGTNTSPIRASVLVKDADSHGESITGSTAAMAYEIADAMLKERGRGPNEPSLEEPA